ncbi:hypothetical protein Syun_001975 [Stephania yunnanensis]|uniref:Uncharacterized protein n=1 Tax=Stephania yunnanensis TaxID=152371 RepID=A0AAP0LFQ7_9MAGN
MDHVPLSVGRPSQGSSKRLGNYIGHGQGRVRKCPEHVAIDQAVEALIEPGGSKGARQLGNCLDHKGTKDSRLGET